MTLTGKTRYRSGGFWFRRVLILQVQEAGRRMEMVGPVAEGFDVIGWRDATVDDLFDPALQPDIIALLIPPGCVVVPEEPTPEMLDAMWETYEGGPESAIASMRYAYRAMLAARPAGEDKP